MTEVVGIRFKNKSKVYFFDPAGVQLKAGDPVVVETSKGLELGECAKGNYEVPDERIVPPLRCHMPPWKPPVSVRVFPLETLN